eukprot:1158207-Pelagomonas_calceolata.AAC.8
MWLRKTGKHDVPASDRSNHWEEALEEEQALDERSAQHGTRCFQRLVNSSTACLKPFTRSWRNTVFPQRSLASARLLLILQPVQLDWWSARDAEAQDFFVPLNRMPCSLAPCHKLGLLRSARQSNMMMSLKHLPLQEKTGRTHFWLLTMPVLPPVVRFLGSIQDAVHFKRNEHVWKETVWEEKQKERKEGQPGQLCIP